MENENKILAQKVFNYAKKILAERRKEFNNNIHSAYVELYVDEDYNNGEWIGYIDVDGKRFGNLPYKISTSRAVDISGYIIQFISNQKKVRGWKNLTYIIDRNSRFISNITLLDNPCKEFLSLQKYLKNYANCIIGDFDLFNSAMSGKRGVLFDEDGQRRYLAHKPIKCKNVLNEMRKARLPKDTISCRLKEENYMDEEERRYSEYQEIECYGEKRRYLDISIKTPSGKVKYHYKLY